MNKKDKSRFIIIGLIILCVAIFTFSIEFLNDKTATVQYYKDKYDEQVQTYEELLEKYAKNRQELNKYERFYGELDG